MTINKLLYLIQGIIDVMVDYYPSITHVLQAYPKGKHFEDWLKKVGNSAEWIVKKAAEEGTKVHEMIEDILKVKK
jgi:hypothetical protein